MVAAGQAIYARKLVHAIRTNIETSSLLIGFLD